MIDIDDMIYDEEETEYRETIKRKPKDTDSYLDNIMESGEEEDSNVTAQGSVNMAIIGTVEKFFEKINVAVVNLTATLKLGDTIKINGNHGTLRMRVSSMQINRKDVAKAVEGDSVGIKVGRPVATGSTVYLSE